MSSPHCREGLSIPLNPCGSLASPPGPAVPGEVAGKAVWNISLALWAAPLTGGALHPRHPGGSLHPRDGAQDQASPLSSLEVESGRSLI